MSRLNLWIRDHPGKETKTLPIGRAYIFEYGLRVELQSAGRDKGFKKPWMGSRPRL